LMEGMGVAVENRVHWGLIYRANVTYAINQKRNCVATELKKKINSK